MVPKHVLVDDGAKKIADVQYCIYADILSGWVGGSKKVQKFVYVI